MKRDLLLMDRGATEAALTDLPVAVIGEEDADHTVAEDDLMIRAAEEDSAVAEEEAGMEVAVDTEADAMIPEGVGIGNISHN